MGNCGTKCCGKEQEECEFNNQQEYKNAKKTQKDQDDQNQESGEECQDDNQFDSQSQSQSESDSEIDNSMQYNTPLIPKKNFNKKRNSVSAEAFGIYNRRQNFKPRTIPKNEAQKMFIEESLKKSFLFRNLDDVLIRIIIDAMEEKTLLKNQVVIKQNDFGDELFMVESGMLLCYQNFQDMKQQNSIKEYNSGEIFGELALLYGAPRAASIKTITNYRQTFNDIVRESTIKKREQFDNFIANNFLLKEIDQYERQKLIDAFKVEFFPRNTMIIQEGQQGDKFYIIEDGFASATKTLQNKEVQQKIKSYSPGDYFGELALLKNQPRLANVIANTNLKCLTLDRESFTRMLGPLEDILLRNSQIYEKYLNNS